MNCELKCIEKDGLPNMDNLTNRVAFIWDSCIVSGWPLENGNWEANDDIGRHGEFEGVTHYVIFSKPLHEIK